MAGRILLADDDQILRDFVAQGLREHGYLVDEASTVERTLAFGRHAGHDLWILDRSMPDGDGLTALQALRAEGKTTPALFLTASRSLSQRVEGLDSGADDYLTKPFSIVEVVARVRALLRRPNVLTPVEPQQGNIRLNLPARRVFVGDREVVVTANEWRLISFLMQRPGVVFSRAQIMNEVGMSESVDEVAVDHLVSRLRQKLRHHGATLEIKTMRGLGFCWGP